MVTETLNETTTQSKSSRSGIDFDNQIQHFFANPNGSSRPDTTRSPRSEMLDVGRHKSYVGVTRRRADSSARGVGERATCKPNGAGPALRTVALHLLSTTIEHPEWFI
ncbi:hypothetical protein EVAR_39376_1 [Eumeta japonica]|uniref:Uncharacterized protein n=1 Tax=Eumeta variegata TaxID=151549 RepID=A0A4C1ZAX6_EUMVA|nr:hypothetical protein EVAR_39376_1 [Eumeta japonica]